MLKGLLALLLGIRLAAVTAADAAPSPAPAAAQDAWSSVRPPLRTFGNVEGPPNMSVYAVGEDHAGRIWLGTQDGSALYNGRTWTNLSLPPESASQFVRAVAETRDGSRWFGTEGGGLWRLKGGAWTQYRVGAGFPSNAVNFLTVVEEDGERWSLWACTAGGGVARFDGRDWTFMDARSGLPSDFVWKIRCLQGPHGGCTLWAATTKGFARLEGTRWHAMGAKDGWPETEVNDIAQAVQPDGSRQIWLSMWGRGLMRWEGSVGTRFAPGEGGFPSSFPINLQVTKDHQGRPIVWASTYDRGLAWFQDGAWRWIDSRKGLPANGIYALYAPRRGKPTLWLGMRGGGLVSLDLSGWYHLDRQLGLPNDEVHAFAETRDPKGGYALWVGTSEGLAHWQDGAWRVEGTAQGLPHDHVASLLVTEGPQGPEVWAGTLKGLARRTASGWRTLFATQGLQDQRILCLLDGGAGSGGSIVWAGTDKGLLRVEGERRSFLTPKDGLPASQIYALARTKDPDGGESLWVGTRGYGIGRFKNGRWTRYGEAEGLVNLSVFCFREVRARDGRRWLWAGTFGGGAVRLDLDDPNARRWEAFTVQDLPGMPSNVVVRIEADASGRLYLATQRGVARLSFEDAAAPTRPTRVETFTAGDGLPPVSTNYGASLMDHAGRLWVATNQGAGVLDPALEVPPPPLPDMLLDRVTVGGRARELDPNGTVLSHRENQLAFEVGLPSFHRQEDIRYRTQLVGLEPQPTAWTPDNRRELAALPAGSYVLHLEAMDHLGRQARPQDFPIRVKPAPWLSVWAYTAYALLLGGALAAFHGIRTRILRLRNQELEARVDHATGELKDKNQALERLNEEKNQFMGIAAHDLKNPLNGVVLYAQLIAGGDMEPEELTHYARMIERAGQHMGELIKNMLDVNRMDTGSFQLDLRAVDLPVMAEDVVSAFESRASAKGLRLVLDAEPALAWADPVHLQDVLENFVSNALKFTPPGPPERSVTVRIRAAGDRSVMEVQDEGPGFTAEDKAKVFGRFVRLSARPTGGEGSSGLGLSIVKRMVEAMQGTVELESEAGKGATFRVTLPAPEGEAG